MLITNLKDYSINVKKYFDLSQCVSLEKVSKYFFPEENIVFHDALTDAKMLQRIYALIEKGEIDIRLSTLEKLAIGLEIDLYELLDFNNN